MFRLHPDLRQDTTTTTATMDIADRNIERAEYQATRTYSQGSKQRRQERRRSQESELSSSDESTSASSRMGRIATASAASLGRTGTRARHPIEIYRTETQRLQHDQTVGSKVKSRASTKPLPEFGGGKPYPPMLPAQEEYVVEFDGEDDPLHPLNWPMRRKYGGSAHEFETMDGKLTR